MTKSSKLYGNQLELVNNFTEVEKIYYIQKEFNLLDNNKCFTKLINKYDKNPKEKYFNNIKFMLEESLDFTKLNNNSSVTFYLMDKNGKIIISNINNTYSTYVNSINNNTYFYNLSEEQGFLNQLYELETDLRVGVNLLETPIANIVVNLIDDPLGILYYLIGKRNKCSNYNLIAFVYTNGTNVQ